MTFFTDANRTRAKEIVARYPRPKSAILPLAHLAQDQSGWLSPEAMADIAELTGVTAAEVQGTCSFYTMFKRRPCGRLLVSVCTKVECLAACGGAPSMQVNYEFHEQLTPELAESLVEDYKSGKRAARTISGSV